jgi:hypothetical protein
MEAIVSSDHRPRMKRAASAVEGALSHHAWSSCAGRGSVMTALMLAALRISAALRASVGVNLFGAGARLWRMGGARRRAG